MGGARGRRAARAIVAPDDAPRAKLDAVERLGGEIIPVPHEEWWQTMVDRALRGRRRPLRPPGRGRGGDGRQRDDRARAVRGRSPEFDTVVIPWGGGGLTTGIASAVKALRPGRARRHGRAGDGCAARRGARAPASRREIEFSRRSSTAPAAARCCRGCGSARSELVDEAVAVPLDEVAEAVRLLASRARVVAEGAGALALAAALRRATDRCVCIVSGGNIDAAVLVRDPGGRDGLATSFQAGCSRRVAGGQSGRLQPD